MKNKVLLADDHGVVRLGIKAIVEKMDNIEVVGEALDGAEALSLIINNKPDIVLLDISMPKMNGIEVAKR